MRGAEKVVCASVLMQIFCSNTYRFMLKRAAPMLRRTLLSLAVVAMIFWIWWEKTATPHVPGPTDTNSMSELVSLCEGDSMLANRLASRLYPAIKVGRNYGRVGLETLDLFGDDAIYLFEEKPDSFIELTAICRLEGRLFSLTGGRWRDAVLQWATAGTLNVYLSALQDLTAEDQLILSEVPESLPLLISDTPVANRMLLRHGVRAWRVFQAVDLRSKDSVERVAAALEHHGESMLTINDQFGPAISWLLVPSPDDENGDLPTLFLDAIAELGVECAASLFLTNYEDLQQLIRESSGDFAPIRSAFAFIASQGNTELREWVADSPFSIRLLLAQHQTRPLGQQVFRRCGPTAATLLYQPGGFGVEPAVVDAELRAALQTERLAVLLVLRDEGWPALEFLWTYQEGENQPLRILLRRPELCENLDDPLISRVIRRLAAGSDVHGQLQEVLLKPAEQLLTEEYPETTGEHLAGWVPGYMALKTGSNWMKGYHITKLDATIAVVDGVTAACGATAIVSQSLKTTTNQTVKKSLAKAGREVIEETTADASRNLGQTLLQRLPGAVLSSIKTLTARTSQLDVTQLARVTTATAKNIGIRSWGSLDRRIIMRRDRKVIVDFLTKEVRDEALDKVFTEIGMSAAMDTAPLLLERILPALAAD